MMSTAAANTSLENATDPSITVPSKTEGIALCAAFILTFVFIVVGNLLTIVLFVVKRSLRKRSLFLVINMAVADLMLGSVSLPLYTYILGYSFELWKGGRPMSLSIFFGIVDTFFSQASLISAAFISGERFCAIYWPFKHRTLSMRAYRIIIFTVWAITILITALWSASYFLISHKSAVYVWTPYVLIITFIISGCNIGIWRKFRRGNISTQQQIRVLRNKRLTKTLLFVSILALLSWIPLVILNCLIYIFDVQVVWRIYPLASIINYSNSFANPVVYALRIPELREALVLCCFRRSAVPDMVNNSRRSMTTSRRDSLLQLKLKQEVLDTKV